MKTIIIGGGIIGLTTAYYLQQDGHEVIVLDKSDLKDGCSYGNAGMIVPSHFIPLAAPGVIAQGIKWMFNAESPFYVRPRISLDLLSWGLKFYKASSANHVKASMPVLRDFNLLSKQLFQELATQEQFNFAFEERGLMMLYNTTKAEEEELHVAELANKLGIEAKPLNTLELQAMEPEAKVIAKGGVFYPGDAHLSPASLIQCLKNYLKANGVQLLSQQEVTSFTFSKEKISQVHTTQKSFEADEVIIASGSWSRELGKLLKINIPLQAGKGYSITLNKPVKQMRIPSILAEAKVAVTPMQDTLRFAGTMEITGIDLSINQRRVQGILKSIPEYLPDYQIKLPENKNIWSGLRPCSPDGLPYVGRSNRFKNVTIATGHAMMGLSLAPATGKLVSEIISKKKTSIETKMLSPNRYK